MTLFSANPLSLSVPEPVFESWLRETGYLEVIDERISSSSSSSSLSSSSTVLTSFQSEPTPLFSFRNLFFLLVSLFTLNPFSKLTVDDFSGETPSWTIEFIGAPQSYSLPISPSQARMRVHENIKRYARNYSLLCLILFACSLYQMPLALLGLVLILGIWELLRKFCSRWSEAYPIVYQILMHIAQIASVVILYSCHVQIAILWALGVSYSVILLHSLFRKLAPPVRTYRVDKHKRIPLGKSRN